VNWIANLPTTNTRIVVTLVLATATAIRYFLGDWMPSIEWLAFLLAMAGVDVAQYTAKRFSDTGYVSAKAAGPPVVTPITTTTTTVSGPPMPVPPDPSPEGSEKADG
jgi:hypothetical protein